MKKHTVRRTMIVAAASLSLAVLAGCGLHSVTKQEASIENVSLLVSSTEIGPEMSGVTIEFSENVNSVQQVSLTVEGQTRSVTGVYPSDENGNQVDGASRYVTVTVAAQPVSDGYELLSMNEQEHVEWNSDYSVSVEMQVNDEEQVLSGSASADSSNVSSQELEAFSATGSYSGTYTNPLTGESDDLTLTYAAYEPDSLSGGEQNPLIIYLHGRWEGGSDTSIMLLDNEVTALADDDIQSYFTSGDQTGAYVLLVQTPTYWMDAGDGEEGNGDLCSRYTEILMDTIKDYLANNPDVDPDRIYLGGGSNGGYMTVEMLIHYPDFFAAAFPISEAYSYYTYATDHNGEYILDFRGEPIISGVNITDSDLQALCNTPIWFVQASSDQVVFASRCVEPLYKALLQAGAENCLCSLYNRVVGDDSLPSGSYNNHWSWIYVFNDEVSCVQDTSSILNSRNPWTKGFTANADGGTVEMGSLFAWLAAQSR